MHEMILCKLGEVVLKGLNRRSFEDKLMSNVNRRVSKCGNFRVYSKQSTIYVEPKDDECDIEAAFESCKKIFGIIAVSKALPCEKAEAVRRESELLAPVRERADFVINTTGLTLSMLQKRICEIFVDGGTRRDILINVVAFGFKYGIPIDADLVFDVRFLPNPYYVEKLRPLSGMDDEVQDYVLRSDVAQRFLEKLTGMIDFLLPQYAAEGRYALTIGIGCTGGQHRSVAVAKALTDYLAARDANVRLRNRDFPRT